MMRNVMFCTPHPITQYCVGDKIENEMGGVFSACGGGKRHVQGFGGERWGKQTTEETQV